MPKEIPNARHIAASVTQWLWVKRCIPYYHVIFWVITFLFRNWWIIGKFEYVTQLTAFPPPAWKFLKREPRVCDRYDFFFSLHKLLVLQKKRASTQLNTVLNHPVKLKWEEVSDSSLQWLLIKVVVVLVVIWVWCMIRVTPLVTTSRFFLLVNSVY